MELPFPRTIGMNATEHNEVIGSGGFTYLYDELEAGVSMQ